MSRGRALRATLVVVLAAVAACRPAAPPPAPPPRAPGAGVRIVTLAPHLAELVYAAGAGSQLVGVVDYTDFPPAARGLPRVGDAFRVDEEAIAALRPDLLLAWGSGNPAATVARLGTLGYRVVTLEPAVLDDVAGHIRTIGRLAGTAPVAEVAAAAYEQRLAALRAAHAGRRPVRTFVELAANPYFTVTSRHFLGQGLALCGGENPFGELPGLTPSVSVEAVIEARPEVIVASDMGRRPGGDADLLAEWRRWPDLPAARGGHLALIDADLVSRPGVRLLDGLDALCRVLDAARAGESATGLSPAGAPAR